MVESATMDGVTIAGIAIGVATLILVTISLIWGTGLWRHREKVEIRVTSLSYSVDAIERKIRVYLGIEFLRSGGNDIRYISQVMLKPEQETYNQLKQYFELPPDGIIRIDARIELPRDRMISSYNNLESLAYGAHPNIQSAEDRGKTKQIATQLSQKSCKIGLVWEDNGKTTWKTISPETFAKWV